MLTLIPSTAAPRASRRSTSPPGESCLRRLVEWQVRLSRRFDRWLPAAYQIDGNRDFLDDLVPAYLRPGGKAYDVGGGKNPVIGCAVKQKLRLQTVGLDIDPAELQSAPPGSYDETICADIAAYCGRGDGDIVICQALLEHVRDVERAIEGMAGILKPGGRMVIFTPSRNAVYARLNRILPQALKCRLLCAIFPGMKRDHGFPAFYDRCTPAAIDRIGRRHGLSPELRREYFTSSYFRFCLPLHVIWRLWLLLYCQLAGAEAAETFSVVFRKES